MSRLPLGSVFKIVLESKSSLRFLMGTVLSFSFSMAVILCTIGLMDGFEITLKKTLAIANGDIKLTSRKGFFIADEKLQDDFEKSESILAFSALLQIESFALTSEGSKGVLLKGIKQQEFQNITGLKINSIKDGIAIGTEFAKKYKMKIGDTIKFALASSKASNQGAAILKELTVKSIVKHGIFEKDMRFIYIDKSHLEQILDYRPGVTNLGMLKIKYFENIEKVIKELQVESAEHFKFEPFWSEFEVLLDAVEIEKNSISLVLQLIVLVAILNIVAFIIYIFEIKAQDFFMLRALGLSLKQIKKFWFCMLFLIWGVSAIVCIGFKEIFAYILANLPFLKIPGDIYVLSELKVILDGLDYLYVYGISLLWVLIIGFIIMRKLNKASVLAGLRQEFS